MSGMPIKRRFEGNAIYESGAAGVQCLVEISGDGPSNYSGFLLWDATYTKYWFATHRSQSGQVNDFIIEHFDGTTYSIMMRINSATGAVTFKGGIVPRVTTEAAAATLTPNAATQDVVIMTGLTAGVTIANPTGTPTDGQRLRIRLKDNGTARSIAWGTAYRSCTGVALPTTTTAGKGHYFGLIYSAADAKWDLVATATET